MARTATIRRPSPACRWPTTSERGSRSFSTTRPIARPASQRIETRTIGVDCRCSAGNCKANRPRISGIVRNHDGIWEGKAAAGTSAVRLVGGRDSRDGRRGRTWRGCGMMSCFTAHGIPCRLTAWATPRASARPQADAAERPRAGLPRGALPARLNDVGASPLSLALRATVVHNRGRCESAGSVPSRIRRRPSGRRRRSAGR
jgi:hypothetical protein